MSITIVHFSDWHGSWGQLPEADLYICTGDMLPNFPHRVRKNIENFSFFEEAILPYIEEREQARWLEKQGNLRKYLGNKDAPVVVVRGNHDFVDLGPFFGGEYFEVNLDPTRTVEYCGLKIGGFRGIPPIMGTWCDEFDLPTRRGIIEQVPDNLDILVSHAPPKGILSGIWGCQVYANLVQRWTYDNTGPRLCCFGHVHEDGSLTKTIGGTIFSNASCHKNLITL